MKSSGDRDSPVDREGLIGSSLARIDDSQSCPLGIDGTGWNRLDKSAFQCFIHLI